MTLYYRLLEIKTDFPLEPGWYITELFIYTYASYYYLFLRYNKKKNTKAVAAL